MTSIEATQIITNITKENNKLLKAIISPIFQEIPILQRFVYISSRTRKSEPLVYFIAPTNRPPLPTPSKLSVDIKNNVE